MTKTMWFAVISCMVAFVACGTEYFVDVTRLDDSGDGMSEASAKHTIQAAVDLATKAGDVVTVLPGTYVEGGGEFDGKGYSRVCVTNAGVTIRSRDGAAVTHIVGQKASSPSHWSGMGEDAVRCVYFANIADGNLSSRLEGFTIRDGYTRYDAKPGESTGGAELPQNKGGGVCYCGDNKPDSTRIYVVDCVITNCAGTRGGGVYGLTSVKTYFGNDKCSSNGSASRHGRHINCVFGADMTIAYHDLVANCTFIGYSSFVTKTVFTGTRGASVYNILVQSTSQPTISEESGGAYTKLVNAVFSRDPMGGIPGDCSNVSGGVGDVFMASALGDWRPRANTIAATAGKVNDLVDHLSALEIVEFGDEDFLGCRRNLDGIDTTVGAFVSVMPTCAFSVIKPALNSAVMLDGHLLPADVLTNTVYSDVWPTQYLVSARGLVTDTRMPVRYRQYRLRDGFGGTGTLQESVPQRLMPKWPDESLWVAPEAAGHKFLQIETAPIFWIDPVNGSDANDGSSREKAFKTWQKAGLEKGENGSYKRTYDVFMFCPGTYGDEQGVYEDATNGKSRIGCPTGFLRLIGVEGPERTIIRGAADLENVGKDGCGANAVRCVYAGSNFSMQGFTLTDGHSGDQDGTYDTPSLNGSGGAVCGMQGSILVDCIISNNVARRAAAVYGGSSSFATLRNCIVCDNSTVLCEDGVLRKCYVVGCLIKGNSGDSGAAAIGPNCNLYETTVIEPKDTRGRPLCETTSINLFNCIVQGGVGPGLTGVGKVRGCLFDGFKLSKPAGDYIYGNPGFVDPANDNFRICNASPAVGLGETTDVDDYTYFLGNRDAAATEWTADGHMTAGCYQSPYAASIYIDSDVEGAIAPAGLVPVTAPGQKIAVTVDAKKSGRPYVGLEVDGIILQDVVKYDVMVPDPLSNDWKKSIRAVFGTNFYVNAETGDDNAFGGSWKTARKTLKGVLDYAKRGDTVLLAPGTYSDGEMLQPNPVKVGCTPYLKCRAYVPEGVVLTSSNGLATASTTIIRGASATVDPDSYGMGSDAVRGVFLESDAALVGVTVVGGRVDSSKVEGNIVPEDDNHHGAGVLCRSSDTSMVRDCILRDNVAPRGGATRYGLHIHCVFTDNRATLNSSVSRDGQYHECYLFGNHGTPTLNYWSEIRGCTFGMNEGRAIGGSAKTVYNTLFVDRAVQSDAVASTLICCALPKDAELGSSGVAAICSDGCVVTDVTQLTVEGDGVPVVGANAAVDAADEQQRQLVCGQTDAAGNPRVANAKMDIGCYEADWRPRYSKDLASRRLTVTEASSEVYEGATTNSLVIPSGTVVLDWENAKGVQSGKSSFKARVTGNGTLAVTLNGVAFADVTNADGLKTLAFDLSFGTVNTLSFTYMPGKGDEGFAEISDFSAPKSGLIMVVR